MLSYVIAALAALMILSALVLWGVIIAGTPRWQLVSTATTDRVSCWAGLVFVLAGLWLAICTLIKVTQ